jgi:hypothetical protein
MTRIRFTFSPPCSDCGQPIEPAAELWKGTLARYFCQSCMLRYRRPRIPETCEGCGRPVVNTRRNSRRKHVVCGPECELERRKIERRAEHHFFRQLLKPQRICPGCGRKFTPKRANQRYHSAKSSCRVKAFRAARE